MAEFRASKQNHGALARSRVQSSPEFFRIKGLPRRRWQDTTYTHLPQPKTHGFDLWPIQKAAIAEAARYRGLFGPIAVGAGKAFISLLAPVACNAQRPVLLVPAALRDQTNLHVIPELSKHFDLHPNLKIMGYSELSLAKNADFLEEYRPDMLIADECHMLASLKSARTRRIKRYMEANPYTVFIALSGTITRKSLRDYWHLLQWSLKPVLCPLPTRWQEIQDWADALDADPMNRVGPGVLWELCDGDENPRQGYQRRLTETPGVVASENNELGVALQLSQAPANASAAIHRATKQLLKTWVTPGGEEIAEVTDLSRKAREIALGFYYRWDPEPPKEWLLARSNWKRFVRRTLQHNRRGLDTELQVFNECKANPIPEWSEWVAVRDSFKINTVPVWFCTSVVEAAARWLEKHRGIVWVSHIAFGKKLAEIAGHPYFGAGERASREILDHYGPAIASINAHGTGKNLQKQWSRGLIVSPSSSGKTTEQLYGRLHRKGQHADTVVFDHFMHTASMQESFKTSVMDAQYLQDTTGVRQKLLYADKTFSLE